MKDFFKLTLGKVLVAKLIGIPLLVIDYFSDDFLTSSVIANIVILIFVSYITSCVIVYFWKRKSVRTSNPSTTTSKF